MEQDLNLIVHRSAVRQLNVACSTSALLRLRATMQQWGTLQRPSLFTTLTRMHTSVKEVKENRKIHNTWSGTCQVPSKRCTHSLRKTGLQPRCARRRLLECRSRQKYRLWDWLNGIKQTVVSLKVRQLLLVPWQKINPWFYQGWIKKPWHNKTSMI